MRNRTLIILNIATFVVVVGAAFLHGYLTQPCQTIIVPVDVPKYVEVPQLVNEINANSSKIRSFLCEKVNIQTWNQGMRMRSQGEIYYEPPKRFRFCVRSAMGEEADMGSNDTVFWFWSRRTKEPGLYYAKYEDFNRTRLKTPLNPIWIRGSLALDPIDVIDAKFSDQDNDFIIAHETRNSIGGKIFAYTFVDKTSKKIRGFALSDFKNRLLASSEVTYASDIPSNISYSWNEENRSMLIEFKNARINKKLDKELWVMPSKAPQIDMGKNIQGLTTLFIDPIIGP